MEDVVVGRQAAAFDREDRHLLGPLTPPVNRSKQRRQMALGVVAELALPA
jgi:hypothetical protein